MDAAHWYLSSEMKLGKTMPQEIEPFWAEHFQTGSFNGVGDVRVNYGFCIPAHATHSVVISSGRIESLLKYKEVIYEFYRNGIAVFILDHRGQGLSARMTDNPHHGYVDHFNQYVDDMCWFVDQVVTPQQRGPLSLLCHSMGAAIGALTILRRPALFERVVFCAPMFGIRPALPDWLARLLIVLNRFYNAVIPGASGYFFGQKDYHPVDFEVNRLTSSEIRYQLFRTQYSQLPEIQLGGVTPQWLAAASAAMWEIEHHAGDIALPALVLSAAADQVVDNKRQQRVVAGMPHAEFITVPASRHEILIERDDIRLPAMQRMLDFITEKRE